MEMSLVVDGVSGLSLEGLEAEICRSAANLTAAEGEWLLLVAEFDQRRGWDVPGCRSCAHWLAWQVSLDLRTAYEKVRVARALVTFPQFAVAMAAGVLSYAKVRSISRIATWANADDLLDIALAGTSNHVERLVAAYRRCEPAADDAEARAHADRGLSVRNEGATTVITLRVPAESGAGYVACLERFVDNTDLDMSLTARRADAALVMAEHAVATFDQSAVADDRYLVTLHLTPDVFDDEPEDGDVGVGVCCVAAGDGLADDPVGVPLRSARRILCDAVIQGFRTGDDGAGERIGRDRRMVSRRLKRALRLRDQGCRFPGCRNTGWVDAHHIQHWLDHGLTIEENLVCLCRFHHRLIHEGRWTISGDPANDVYFHRPDGRILPAAPPLRIGDTANVDAHGRTPADGRCQWDGDPLHLAYSVTTIIANAHVRPERPERAA